MTDKLHKSQTWEWDLLTIDKEKCFHRLGKIIFLTLFKAQNLTPYTDCFHSLPHDVAVDFQCETEVALITIVLRVWLLFTDKE